MSEKNVFRTPADEIDRWMSEAAPRRNRHATVIDIAPRIEARRESRSYDGVMRKHATNIPNHRRR